MNDQSNPQMSTMRDVAFSASQAAAETGVDRLAHSVTRQLKDAQEAFLRVVSEHQAGRAKLQADAELQLARYDTEHEEKQRQLLATIRRLTATREALDP